MESTTTFLQCCTVLYHILLQRAFHCGKDLCEMPKLEIEIITNKLVCPSMILEASEVPVFKLERNNNTQAVHCVLYI